MDKQDYDSWKKRIYLEVYLSFLDLLFIVKTLYFSILQITEAKLQSRRCENARKEEIAKLELILQRLSEDLKVGFYVYMINNP